MESLKKLILEKESEATSQQQPLKKWQSKGVMKKHRSVAEIDLNPNSKKQKEEATRLAKLTELLSAKNKSTLNLSESTDDTNVNVLGDAQVDTATGDHTEKNGETLPKLPKPEVIRRLRRLKEPITLFGETDAQRFNRMCQLELEIHEDEVKFGRQNVLIDVLAGRDRSKAEQYDEDEDDLAAFDHEKVPKPFASSSLIPSEASNSSAAPNVTEGLDQTGAEDAKASTSELSREMRVRNWIKHMLHGWDEELRSRTDEEKRLSEGKMATGLHRQTRKDLKPLLRKLKSNQLEEDVLDKLSRMVDFCEQRRYRDAHDLYMLLAIGNAAWPMGVTMVGIHERAGRSKIFTSEVAHILNDETTRKYIQMFKRLISFCQRKYPADPSQMVKISTVNV